MIATRFGAVTTRRTHAATSRASSRSFFRPCPGNLRDVEPHSLQVRAAHPPPPCRSPPAPPAQHIRATCPSTSRRPHLRVLRRRKAIEKPRIALRPRLSHRARDLIDAQRQRHAIAQHNPLHPTRPLRPRCPATAPTTPPAPATPHAPAPPPHAASAAPRTTSHPAAPSATADARRHSSHSASRFSPVPNPSSPTMKCSRPAHASGSPHPPRNTARFSDKSLARKIHIAMPPRERQRSLGFKRREFQIGQGRQARHQSFARVAVTM